MKKLIVTGGAGFIGSALVHKLNKEGIDDIVIVDALAESEKWKNLVRLRYSDYLHKNDFIGKVSTDTLNFEPQAVVHMGACSQTTMPDADFLMENNYRYTQVLVKKTGCPLVFRSLEEAVRDYIVNHLATDNPYLDPLGAG